MPKRWLPAPPSHPDASVLASRLDVSPVVAQILLTRGLLPSLEVDPGRRFLDPRLEHLHDPFLLPDATTAVERVARAIREGEKILVHGDYDADGVCAAALMTRVLRVVKANVEVFVPHRRVDGYDLQVETVRRAAEEGVRLIITVDCGIVAFRAAEEAKRLGIDLIVTDHHEPHPDGRLPDALAVVNPKRPDSAYPFAELCGTAVAYKFCDALVRHMGLPTERFRTAFLDLVALATCTDCMPLVDENRIFVRHGVETLRGTNKAGLQALMRVAMLKPASVGARNLGFALGPRINAIGRLDAAEHALTLLLTSDAEEAKRLAELLDSANAERQREQERMFQDALRQTERHLDDPVLVLGSPRWHPGIIGIVASKLVEALHRPAIILAIDEENGTARGSCRSMDGFHIFEALNSCRHLLAACGGHQAAAGFDMPLHNLEAFRTAIQEYGAAHLDEDALEPTLYPDAELHPEALELRLAHDLAAMEPFGHGNHEPLFVTRGLKVVDQKRLANKVQSGIDHLKLRVQTEGDRTMEALFWRAWPRANECLPGSRVDLCHTVELNRHNGYTNIQLNLKDLRASE